jgi:hypothetical protein
MTRDATNSFKGYEFQYYYFIEKILEEYKNINYIIFEGCEDIDIMYNNNKYSIIQVKYHSANDPTEGCGTDSGFTKVLNSYMKNNYIDKYKNNINEIVYFINNENKLNSPEFKKNIIKNDDNRILFLQKKYSDYDISLITEFSNKLIVINNDNININNIINKILNLIDTNIFFDIGENNLYKKEIILCKLTKKLINHIFNSDDKKLYLNKLFDEIKIDINNDYTLDFLQNEIICGLKSNNNIIIHQSINILNTNILYNFELIKLYKILEIITIKNESKLENNIKIIIINKIMDNIKTSFNYTNFSNIKFIMSHINQLLINKKHHIIGENVIDIIKNINKNNYCLKYQSKNIKPIKDKPKKKTNKKNDTIDA